MIQNDQKCYITSSYNDIYYKIMSMIGLPLISEEKKNEYLRVNDRSIMKFTQSKKGSQTFNLIRGCNKARILKYIRGHNDNFHYVLI